MFSSEEVQALVLGSRWLAERGEGPLAAAAREALSKIAALVPVKLAQELDARHFASAQAAQCRMGGTLSGLQRTFHERAPFVCGLSASEVKTVA